MKMSIFMGKHLEILSVVSVSYRYTVKAKAITIDSVDDINHCPYWSDILKM